MSKAELRKVILEKRNSISLDERREKDNSIKKKLLSTSIYKRSQNIFIYINYGSEVATKEIIEHALNDGKNIFTPQIMRNSNEMKAVKIESFEKLVENKYGILEPKEINNSISRKEIDLIIMPGVVFDKLGGRIGYGGGYYDRYLEKISATRNKVALAYDFQILDKLNCDKHDIAVDCLITNEYIYKFSHEK